MVTIANLQKRQRPPPEPCSNRGTCDLTQGICICQFGFTGSACQIVDLCPSESDPYPCNGHGKCQSARQQFVDAGKTDAMYEATWAAMADSHDDWLRYRYGESWHSCVCEEGYGGWDCAERLCPYGDYPNGRGARELQIFECHANSGDFFLQYGQENTTAISARATASELKAALEALRAISSVEVTFSNAAETYVCHNGTVGHNIVQIRFNDFEYYYKGYYGELSVRNASVPDLPNLIAHNTSNLVNTTWTIDGPTETLANYPGNLYLAADGAALPANTSAGNFSVMATSVAGTRQYLECSGKGTCDHTTDRKSVV